MGTPIVGFGFSLLFAELREAVTDFTANLTSELTIVEIEKLGWGVTMRTGRANRHFTRWVAVMDGLQRMAVSVLKTSQ